LVKKYQEEYLQAKKRDKPAVASMIVSMIRKKGGRFLRRTHAAGGHVLWVDIGDDRAREKTCQALREGAPEIRRLHCKNKKKQSTSHTSSDSEEDDSHTEKARTHSSDATLSSPSTMDRALPGSSPPTKMRSWAKKASSVDDFEDHGCLADDEGPVRIRPMARLMPGRLKAAESIALDQLSPEDRELYLHDFLPPCLKIRNMASLNEDSKPSYVDLATVTTNEERNTSVASWPAVTV
jgi:hypothetical protein